MRELVTVTKTSSELMQLVEQIRRDPEAFDREPFQILDNIFYVGNSWVGAYLIDTGDGLLLIDSNFSEVMPILLRNIKKVGFSVQDIRWLLLSHGHFDHIGGAAEIQRRSNCEIWFSPDELFMLKERRDLIGDTVEPFQIDHLYEYGKAFCCGNIRITPVLTPGHTLGCTSLMLQVPFQGCLVNVGVHGGLGLNGLTQAELQAKKLPLDMPIRYLRSLEELKKRAVQVFLPLHNAYYDIFSLAEKDDGPHTVFIQPNDWKTIMQMRIAAVKELMDREQIDYKCKGDEKK